MEIVVKARHCEVTDRFRSHVTEKLGRITRLDARLSAVDVELSEEHNPRRSDARERIEITVRRRGPVIRAEAAAQDAYAALDLAVARLEERLRRAQDRRRVHHGARTPASVRLPGGPAPMPSVDAAAPVNGDGPSAAGAAPLEDDDSPERWLVSREKVHEAVPTTLGEALYAMELVGHDFFLFVDAEHDGAPSVVYRRRGFDYGVIRLKT